DGYRAGAEVGLLRLRRQVHRRDDRARVPGADSRRDHRAVSRLCAAGAPVARLPRHQPFRLPLGRPARRGRVVPARDQHPARHDAAEPGPRTGQALRDRLSRAGRDHHRGRARAFRQAGEERLMAQTIRRNAAPARRQARAHGNRTKVRKAKAKTNSLIDALMRVLPFTEEQLQKTFLVLILAAAAAGAWTVASMAGLTELAGRQLAYAAADAGYEVERVEVRGVERMNELRVYERVLGQRDQAMPLVDVHALRDSLRELAWVKDARVSRQLPDTIVVDIVEREPHAALRKADRLVLIDETGVELEPISEAEAREMLLISGPGAQARVEELSQLLD